MLQKRMLTSVWLILFLTVWAGAVSGDTGGDRFYIQPLFGKMQLGEDDPNIEGGSYELSFLGIAVQQPLNPPRAVEAFQYGMEAGFVGSWENDVRAVQISSGPDGGTVKVQISNQWFLGDLFFGGFASYTIAERVRLYVGAGPLLVYGRRHVEPEPESESDTEYVPPNVEQGLGLGVYARAGLEVTLTKQFRIGAGVRGLTTGLTFKEGVGDVRVEGVQGYLNFTMML
jgi:hypothetical protein